MAERLVEMARKYKDQIILRIPHETANYASISGGNEEFIVADFVSAYDPESKILNAEINEKAICRIISYRDESGIEMPYIVIPNEIVSDFHIEDGEFIEVVFGHIVKKDRIAEIFPGMEIIQNYPYWWRQMKSL